MSYRKLYVLGKEEVKLTHWERSPDAVQHTVIGQRFNSMQKCDLFLCLSPGSDGNNRITDAKLVSE